MSLKRASLCNNIIMSNWELLVAIRIYKIINFCLD
jgi:hypothetical protein